MQSLRRTESEELTLPLACQELGVSWRTGHSLLLQGKLAGRQVRGRWLVTRASVLRYKADVESVPQSA